MSVASRSFTRSSRKPMNISSPWKKNPVPLSRVRIDQLWLSRTPWRQDIFYSAAILGHFISVLKLSMRTKTGFPRFLGSKIPLSQSLYWRPSADQKARGLWVWDWLVVWITMEVRQEVRLSIVNVNRKQRNQLPCFGGRFEMSS